MHARYDGPFIIVARNKGGAYIICDLDGSVFDRPIAAFRVVPYFARQSITMPPDFLDIAEDYLERMKAQTSLGDDDPLIANEDLEDADEGPPIDIDADE